MRRGAIKQTSLIVLLAILACTHDVSAAGSLSFSTGANFSSGKYGGTTATDIWYVPFTARYQFKRSLFRITIPYLHITGPQSVIDSGINSAVGNNTFAANGEADVGDIGSALITTTTHQATAANTDQFARETRSGLGDMIASLTYQLIYHQASQTAFNITGRIKIPTASTAQRLGTGQVDYAIQGDLLKSFSNFNLRATFGYRILGDSANYNFRNVFYGGASAGYKITSNALIGTNFNIRQSSIYLQDARTLSIYYAHRITNNIRVNVYGLKGLSDRSPDWGSGITLRYNF